jgi:hypothetical protein
MKYEVFNKIKTTWNKLNLIGKILCAILFIFSNIPLILMILGIKFSNIFVLLALSLIFTISVLVYIFVIICILVEMFKEFCIKK